MNWIDVIIILTFGIYLYEGVRRGFVEQMMELFGFFFTILLAMWTYEPVGGWLVQRVGIQEPAAGPFAFLIVWVAYQALYAAILRNAYPMMPVFIKRSFANRMAGVAPALLKSFIIVSILLTATAILPVPAKLKSEIENSQLGSRFVSQASHMESYINRIFGRDLRQSLTFLTVPAQTEEIIQPNERVNLKFTTEEVTVDKQAEQKMLALLNAERQKVGLKPVVWDEKLAEVARAHSRDMFKRGYFSHENPDGESPFDRMEAAGIRFKAAGENLAYAATVELAHNGLMRSPGHRANILEKEFGKIGIGVIDGGIYGKMFTQNFTD